MEELVKQICMSNIILVVGHIMPDGDAIGSAGGLSTFLNSIGKKSFVYLEDVPDKFKYMLENTTLLDFSKVEEKLKEFDLIIFVDGGEAKRFPNSEILLSKINKRMCIDHHIKTDENGQFVEYMYVEENSPSTTQIIYKLLNMIDYEKVDKKVLEPLLSGLITDTGGFRYPLTNYMSFNIAKEAYIKGVNIPEIFERTSGSISKTQLAIESLALSKIRYYGNDKISCSTLTLKEQNMCNIKAGETARIVTLLRDIEGISVSVFGRETEDGLKFSFRRNLNANIDLNVFARNFGGGGHEAASGINIKTEEKDKEKLLKEMTEKIIKKLEEELEKNDRKTN